MNQIESNMPIHVAAKPFFWFPNMVTTDILELPGGTRRYHWDDQQWFG